MSFLLGFVVVICFAISAGLTRRFCDPASRFHILDHPNERSLHTQPTPRSGGVAVLAAILAGMLGLFWWFPNLTRMAWIGAGMLLVAGVSFVDDRRSLSVTGRLLVHVFASTLLLWGGLSLRRLPLFGMAWELPLWLGAVISLFATVWMVNLYNFMDGMDGFAGGMAVIGFGGFAALGWLSGNVPFFVTSMIISAATAGFLVYNFPPARIFMGDVGSSTMGFLAAALSLWGARDGVFPIWTALLVFSPFVVDATVTLLARLVRGEKVWQAHRSHYYQRLVQIGWGHRRTVLWEYALMLSCVASALWLRAQAPLVQIVVFLGWVLAYSGLMALVHHMERRHRQMV